MQTYNVKWHYILTKKYQTCLLTQVVRITFKLIIIIFTPKVNYLWLYVIETNVLLVLLLLYNADVELINVYAIIDNKYCDVLKFTFYPK